MFKFKVSQFNESYLWVLSFLVFVLYRMANGTLITEGTIIGLILYGMSCYFWVIPFIVGKDMELLSYSDSFKKGENDSIRYLLFFAGLAAYCVSVVA